MIHQTVQPPIETQQHETFEDAKYTYYEAREEDTKDKFNNENVWKVFHVREDELWLFINAERPCHRGSPTNKRLKRLTLNWFASEDSWLEYQHTLQRTPMASTQQNSPPTGANDSSATTAAARLFF